MVCCVVGGIVARWGSDPEHQISDGVGVGIGTTPADGFASGGAHPDHAGLAPCLAQAVGVVDVGSPVATPLIEGLPGGGLNGEGHRLFAVERILQDDRSRSPRPVDSGLGVTVPRSSRSSRRHRWQDHPNARRRQW